MKKIGSINQKLWHTSACLPDYSMHYKYELVVYKFILLCKYLRCLSNFAKSKI